jgi:hypothetical protein
MVLSKSALGAYDNFCETKKKNADEKKRGPGRVF